MQDELLSLKSVAYFFAFLTSTLHPCRSQLSGAISGGIPGGITGAIPGAGSFPGALPGAFPGSLSGAFPGPVPGAFLSGGTFPGPGAILAGFPPAGGGVPGAIPGTMTSYPMVGTCPPGQNPNGQCQVTGICFDKGTICVGGTCCTQGYLNNGQISQCPQGTFPNGSRQ